MMEMQTADPDTWTFLDEANFVISKRGVPFTAIDPDHAIEQEHRKMKVKGGLVGITGNEQAMEKYFIIAPSLARLVHEFKEYAGIETRTASSLHHDIGSQKSTKLVSNAAKVADVLNIQGNPFVKEDMHNLVTFAVMPDYVSNDIENRDQLGRDALEKFIANRMVDKTVEFWDPQKNNNFSYFKDAGAVVQTKIKGQLMHIKQERRLLSRLLVIAKSRPEFELKDAIGKFELNVTPPSNFHPDGSMIMLSSKSNVVPLVMNMAVQDGKVDMPPERQDVTKVIIIDAMCVVNMVVKTPEMTTSKHFASKFLQIIGGMSASYDEIRIVFDQYLPGMLKQTTRDRRTMKTTSIHYHVNDDTEIKSVKAFLAHINTKAELTAYLSDKIISHYQNQRVKVLVMHHTTMESNHPLSEVVSLPALSTDVFVLLTAHFSLIPQSTTLIRRGGERIRIQESYMKLGRKRAEAKLGWYAFKGTDNTGSFAGKGVACHFKAFLQADDEMLDAFANFGLLSAISPWIHRQMEKYVCLLYKIGNISSDEVPELRWMLCALLNVNSFRQP